MLNKLVAWNVQSESGNCTISIPSNELISNVQKGIIVKEENDQLQRDNFS